MNSNQFHASIASSWGFVENLGMGVTISTPNSLEINEEFRNVCLRGNSSYREIYEKGLSLSFYNFVIFDYSFFQFSLNGDDDVRYVYYPNPYVAGNPEMLGQYKKWRELLEGDFITFEEYSQLVDSVGQAGRVPMIRYDNSPEQYRRIEHPCAHFHIGRHDDNRWAVDRFLTPFTFTMLIIKQYYGEYWRLGADDSDPFGNEFESILVKEKARCTTIPEEYFHKSERETFFIG